MNMGERRPEDGHNGPISLGGGLLRIRRLNVPLRGRCGVCGELWVCGHVDADFESFVCDGCSEATKTAEIKILAWISNGASPACVLGEPGNRVDGRYYNSPPANGGGK